MGGPCLRCRYVLNSDCCTILSIAPGTAWRKATCANCLTKHVVEHACGNLFRLALLPCRSFSNRHKARLRCCNLSSLTLERHKVLVTLCRRVSTLAGSKK